MSTSAGDAFGEKHSEKYQEFLRKWEKKIDGQKVSKEMAKEWGNDLAATLGDDLVTMAEADMIRKFEAAGIEVADKGTIRRWVETAIKVAVVVGAIDLLRRAVAIKNNEPDQCKIIRPNPEFAICFIELISRAFLTLRQIFDMVKDAAVALAVRFFTRRGEFTGRRRWVSENGKKSRHSSLNGQIRNEDARFNYKGDKIYGPRPINGHPDHWSNCSCTLVFERKRGGKLEWVNL